MRLSKVLLTSLLLLVTSVSYGQDELEDMTLADLMGMEVLTTSKIKAESTMDAPGIITTITAEEIRRFGANNLKDVINRLNGVYLTGSGVFRSQPIAIRGDLSIHYNIHSLILINGRPFRESGFGGADSSMLRAFPVDVIERVELVRGPGSVLYGTNAYSGVFNIITKKKIKAMARGGIGSDNTYLARAASGTDKSVFGIQHMVTDGDTLEFEDQYGTQGKHRFGNRDVGAFTQINEKNLSVSLFAGTSKEQNLGAIQSLPPKDFHNRRVFVDVNYKSEYSDTDYANYYFTYNYHNTDFDFEGAGPGDDDIESIDLLWETTQFFKLADNLELTVGGIVEKQNDVVTLFRKALDVEAYNIYLSLKYQPMDSLALFAGAQGNKVYFQDDMEVVPRVGVIYNQDNKWGAKVLYGGAFRTPAAAERFLNAGPAVQGTEDLKSETVTTLDVQVSTQMDDINLALTYFMSDYKDLLGRVPSATLPGGLCPSGIASNCYDNVADRTISGFELDGKWVPNLNTIVNLGLLIQENEDEVSGVKTKDAAFSPNTQIKLGVSYIFDFGLTLGLQDVYNSKLNLETNDPTVTNPTTKDSHYLTLNLRADLNKMAGLENSFFELYATNLGGEDIFVADFNRKAVNTLPYTAGTQFYASFIRNF